MIKKSIIVFMHSKSCQIVMKLEFSGQMFENTQMSNIMKIHRVGAELFYADGRTDRYDEANNFFSQFCEHD